MTVYATHPCGCKVVGAGNLPDPVTIQYCPQHAAAPEMYAALEAVLLFHGGGIWDERKRERWTAITGNKDATTKVPCDTVRAALARARGEETEREG